MSLQTSAILVGATVSATGGTSTTFTCDGNPNAVKNGVHVIDMTQLDMRIRKSATFKYTPAPLLNGYYGKDKKTVSFVFPSIDSLGKIQFNKIYIERSVHSEVPAADVIAANGVAAQILFDSDFDNFWKFGSLA
jgi:hypothetical protein